MPLIEAHFADGSGNPDAGKLLAFGPTTQVIVGKSAPTEKHLETKNKLVPALIDTGAGDSVIDEELAKELGLVPIDKAMVSGVGGSREHIMYMARISVPQLDLERYGKLLGAPLKAGGQQHEVLLGRDLLAYTIMIYDGIRAQVTIASPKRV